MRISEVCAKVHLTERAVRLYIREGLVQPGQRNGITVFDAEGIERLEQIAALRRADFSIEEIRRMLSSPGEIDAVVGEKKKQLTQRIEESQMLLSVLENIGGVEQLVEAIRSAEVPAAGPIRTSFDELSVNGRKKRRHTGGTGEARQARLMLSALNNVQSFGGLQLPVRGRKNPHLPEPDSVSFYESQFDECDGRGEASEIDAAGHKGVRRRNWLRIYAVVVAVLTVLFILYSLWLGAHIDRHEGESAFDQNSAAYKKSQLQQELREILEIRDSQ